MDIDDMRALPSCRRCDARRSDVQANIKWASDGKWTTAYLCRKCSLSMMASYERHGLPETMLECILAAPSEVEEAGDWWSEAVSSLATESRESDVSDAKKDSRHQG